MEYEAKMVSKMDFRATQMLPNTAMVLELGRIGEDLGSMLSNTAMLPALGRIWEGFGEEIFSPRDGSGGKPGASLIRGIG